MEIVATREAIANAIQENTHDILSQFQRIRSDTERLCQPLEADDYNIQTMPDVSPVKWHIAHVSWFFETFLLAPYLKDYKPFHPQFTHIFNSYYETVGTFHPRPQRGLLNRPTTKLVFQYRAYIDSNMTELLEQITHKNRRDIEIRTQVGINHEQQHQELLLTDIKHVFANNPLKPAYHQVQIPTTKQNNKLEWFCHLDGVAEIGFQGRGFCYDNELPSHKVYVPKFNLASRLVTNGEYQTFMEDGGYERTELWLSDAWSTVQQSAWQAPLYWQKIDNEWHHMTLSGLHPVDENAPVCHVSFYEADAYARWAGKRLPSEAEWELLARDQTITGNFRDSGIFHPTGTIKQDGVQQLWGDVWEWTQSPYSPYPGFEALPGSLGEYNGKFMCSQFVLRGGSCITPQEHIRATYRNFFYPKDRWQFSGIRLAEDV